MHEPFQHPQPAREATQSVTASGADGTRPIVLIESLLSMISAFVIPLAIAAICVFGLFAWSFVTPPMAKKTLDFRVAEDAAAAMSPRSALERLATAQPVVGWSTKNAESPFWFDFNAVSAQIDEPVEIVFPSRHMRELICWDAATLHLLGSANRTSSSGAVRPAAMGFAVKRGASQAGVQILCRATFMGPAYLSVVEWPASQFEPVLREFWISAGVLDGALVIFVGLSLILAYASRELVFVVFASWLFVTIGTATTAAGADFQFLGSAIPPGWAFPLRGVSGACCYIVMFALFAKLFAHDIVGKWEVALLRSTQWLAIPLLLSALFIPYHVFLVVLWVTAAFGVATVLILCGRLLIRRGSLIEIAYSAAIGVAVLNFFYDIAISVAGLKEQFPPLDTAVTAILTSLCAMLAVFEHVRQKQRAHQARQNEVSLIYQALPVGLFLLDTSGNFLSGNPAGKEMLGVNPGELQRHWNDFFAPGSWEDLLGALHDGEEFVAGIRNGGHEPRQFSARAARNVSGVQLAIWPTAPV
jgi:PAS domain-containing protein